MEMMKQKREHIIFVFPLTTAILPPTSEKKNLRYFGPALQRCLHERREPQSVAGVQINASIALVNQVRDYLRVA